MNPSALLGANWRTTLFGLLFLLAGYISINPDSLAGWLDPLVAKKIASLAAFVSGFAAFANTKDRQVSGNGTLDDPTRAAKDGRSVPLNALLALMIPVLFFAGCTVILAGCAHTRPLATSVPGEYRWQEDGWIACSGQRDPDPAAPVLKRKPVRPLRFSLLTVPELPPDLPESWRRTLCDGDRVIEPRVILGGHVVAR